ncbi:MAG: SCO family protein [Gammaproteobacteria bacterium]
MTARTAVHGRRWWVAIAILVSMALGAGLWWGKRPVPSTPPPALESFLWPLLPPLEPFQLAEADGGPLTDQQLLGQWTLLYFCYLAAEDFCRPFSELVAEIAVGLRDLAPFSARGQVLFVSFDAARDSPEALREFARRLGPRVRAATAPPEALHLLTRQLAVQSTKVSTGEAEDYGYAFAPALLLIDPEARAVAEFRAPFDRARIRDDVSQIIGFLAGRAGNADRPGRTKAGSD